MARGSYRFILGIFLLGLSWACTSRAATFYVEANGSDSGPGTQARPWRSLEALRRRVWAAGDAVYLCAGESFSGLLELPGHGSDSHPVIIGSYGQGRATISAPGESLFYGYNQGGFQFQDLDLTSSWGGGSAGGIVFYTDSPAGIRYPGITVKNCDLRGFGGPAIKIASAQPSNPGWSRVRVENCRCGNSGAGMVVRGFDSPHPRTYAIGALEVRHSEFANNSGTGLSISGVASGLVEYCAFHDNQRVGGCWTWATRGVVIQHCIAYANRCGGDNDGFGFDMDGGSVDCTIQDCLSYQNDTAGFAIFDYPNSADTAGDSIRFCISENDVRSGHEGAAFEINSWADTPIRNCRIYNCAAYVTSHGGDSICAGFLGIGRQSGWGAQSGSISACGFWNNIIYLAGEGSDLAHIFCQPGAGSPREIAIQGNLYAGSGNRTPRILTERGQYSTLADWRRRTGQERIALQRQLLDCGLAADPRCAAIGQSGGITDPAQLAQSAIWRPLPGSPCLRAGIDLATLCHITPVPADFYGNPIPAGAPATVGVAGPASMAK
ncbi:MAG TPA: right-handed parallel beta-helix repeat-containing protein [Chthoniobacteraceae bacterium]|nr:right-handed parallel beta-helix repeat-containing protein [Chthoniobacteraceae bacterium]